MVPINPNEFLGRSEPGKPVKKMTKNILLVIGTLFVTLAFVESVSWYVMSRIVRQPLMYTSDPYVSFTLLPGSEVYHAAPEYRVTYRINAQGFRGPDVSVPKSPGHRRVLVLGDSFAFGWGVELEDSVSRKLEAALALDGQTTVEVINGGFAAGKSPDDAYAFLLSPRGRALEPEVVVELIFVRNDIRDIEEHHWLSLDSDGLPLVVRSAHDYPNELHGRGPLPYYKSNPILANLSSIQLAMRAYFALVELPRRADMIRSKERAIIARYGGLSRRMQALVSGLAARSAEHRYCLLVGLIATRTQVTGQTDDPYDLLLVQLRDALESAGVAQVVLGRDIGLVESDFFPKDGHWNRAGHAKVAQGLARQLRSACAL